jgi:hypothetical protein
MMTTHYTPHNALKRITDVFLRATEKIDELYFRLPVEGKEDLEYRERVYCYELYHWMRCFWPDDMDYKITGELDKRAHPILTDPSLADSKPDFTIHKPGKRENLLVMEVKRPDPCKDQIEADLRKLTAFRGIAEYTAAYYLIYGDSAEKAKAFAAKCSKIAIEKGLGLIDLSKIELYSHAGPYTRAYRIQWPD